ncbi:putative glycoside hydrolase family 2 protein [Neofusicoccum parvum UCRNP2]|uniref:Putative glycoside hydrolase family 2 protein n=1 Tax=Botryosphaeria parva (strain UCR-NP2) TaxID=1287680 RepID=R1EKN4_BOTPV|nr:putative glycoside hydrolase family 2 protein [Neofusicoccum parvum UCRNP2]
MAAPLAQAYPRPDFERADLHWRSLNGPWDFLFDDDDVGLSERWQLQGLPDQVVVTGAGSSKADESESASITQKIAAGTQNLIKDNLAFRGTGSRTNTKRPIQVPYVFQAPASGINERGDHEVLWYERAIEDPRSAAQRERGDRTLLRFGAVDYDATIWLGGQYVGGHRGGHVPFELDISDVLDAAPAGPLRLTVRAYDSAYDLTQPRGKQYWGAKPESIFYTPSGGIWQSVWLETVPRARIADSSSGTVLRASDIDSGELDAQVAVLGRRAGTTYRVELAATLGGVPVATSPQKALPKDKNLAGLRLGLRLSPPQQAALPDALRRAAPLDSARCWRDGVALWSPEHPLLYDLTLRLFDAAGALVDEVHTTTGVRSLSWTAGDGALHLNGRPLFQALVLDQGYWPDTFMTPPSPDALKADIELSKKMGFNGCRKHQKVEDPVFLYWADRLGYLVWGEMANAYQFSQEYVERFNQEWIESVKRDINHPCIITWTPVNESWAYTALKDSVEQRNHIRALYYLTKTLDPTRPINDNCGWEHVCTDLTTFHDYSDAPALTETCSTLQGILKPKAERPMFVAPIPGLDPGAEHRPGAVVLNTEFGGVNIAPATGDSADEWGYTTASDPQDLLQRIERLMRGVVQGGHSSGFVYTQLADIEQETNGLYSFDRKEKLSAEKVRAVVDEVLKIFYASRGL